MLMSRVDRQASTRIVLSAIVSVIAWIALQGTSPRQAISWSEEMLEAAERMEQEITTIGQFCEATGIPVDELRDPNRTCLIGPEYTPLFTTLGQLEAKRTTTSPDLAGLMVHLLRDAGATAGDTIAVGASASFPGLLIATLAAADAMDLVPVTIISLGSSSYGATLPEFNLLHIYELLLDDGLVVKPPAGISLGGEHDVAAEFDAVFRDVLLQQISTSGIPLISDADLQKNVDRRLATYSGVVGNRAVVFVNIGGSDANLGVSPLILELAPGLNTKPTLPPRNQRGVLFEMAARGVPVIHLLHVRGLAHRYSLPWDPIPLPEPGATVMRDSVTRSSWGFWLVTTGYFVSLGLIGLLKGKEGKEMK
jgi:poly-gamma-glutamate system protein